MTGTCTSVARSFIGSSSDGVGFCLSVCCSSNKHRSEKTAFRASHVIKTPQLKIHPGANGTFLCCSLVSFGCKLARKLTRLWGSETIAVKSIGEQVEFMQKTLEGIRVLDLSRMLPGPYASMMLGDLGAEVIKVEETKIGDPTRRSPPLIGERSAAFLQVNRNKKSIALDLKQPQARDIFLKLAATADVVLEQFRPGVVDRLGISYDAVKEINPRIVYCSLTGFGQTGPHRDRSGHDLNYLALSGVLGLTTDERGKPVIPGVQVADLAGGTVAAFAMLAALIARERTGRGQYVDVSMFDVMLSMLPVPACRWRTWRAGW